MIEDLELNKIIETIAQNTDIPNNLCQTDLFKFLAKYGYSEDEARSLWNLPSIWQEKNQ